MLKNAYQLAKIVADTAENERNLLKFDKKMHKTAGRLAAGEGDGRRVDDDRGLDLPIFTVLGFQKTVRNFQQLLRKLSLSFFLGDASKQLPFERFSKIFENIVIFKSLV